MIRKKPRIQEGKTPFYFVKKRLLANIPAVFGMVIILLAILTALLGYTIMPDSTPYADDRMDAISQKPPGFQVQVLQKRKNLTYTQENFFVRNLFGQESAYQSIPIEDYRIDEASQLLYIQEYDKPNSEVSYPLIDVVKAVYVGKSENSPTKEKNWVFIPAEGKVRYLDLKQKMQEVSLTELLKEFQAHCIETRTYVLGTDVAGRDMLSRLMFGVRISLGIGLVSVIISFVVGFTLGSLAGFFGGWVDNLIMWFMTVVWSIPGIMLVIAISLALGRGIFVAFIAIGLTTWVEIARVVRGQILSVKQKLYVEAARALGVGNMRIITVHIFPNIFGPLIVILTSNFASAILTEAGLSFLGLSAQPPVASWGVMVNEGFSFIINEGGFYLVLFPSVCIALLVLAFNLFGNGLRDAYDPKNTV